MKKFFILGVIAAILFSCSFSDDDVSFTNEILPIEEVDIPDEFTLGEVYPITVTYERPTNCHSFRDFYYLSENNVRTVAIISALFENNNCVDLIDESLTATFNFKVTSNGSYIFKFWQGQDENEEDIFLEIEVPVVD
ncbi:MAG: hypothetical protein ACON5F_04850 [Jejuia sp.]